MLGDEADLWYISLETRLPDFVYFLMRVCARRTNLETVPIILSLIQ